MENHTGIRQMIVDIVQGCVTQSSIQEGVVKSASPLKITLAEDKKIELTDASVIVPGRLKGEFGKGDRLHLLVAGGGRQYYVLDKA